MKKINEILDLLQKCINKKLTKEDYKKIEDFIYKQDEDIDTLQHELENLQNKIDAEEDFDYRDYLLGLI